MQYVKSLLGAAGLAALVAVAPAHAELAFGASEGLFIQTFDDVFDTSTERVQIGSAFGFDVGVSSLNGPQFFGPPYGAWSLGDNGEWNSARTFVGVDGGYDDNTGAVGSLVFDFGGQTVSEVGAVINFDPGFTYGGGFPLPLYIAAYDTQGALLESWELPLFTPGAVNEGVYYGFKLEHATIARFEVSGPYAVVDNLSFSQPVPEPSTWALLVAGLGAVGWAARRRAA